MIVLAVFTDGRDNLLAHTLASATMLHGAPAAPHPITRRVIHDDTGDPRHADELRVRYPGFTVIGGRERCGFGGAIRSMWAHLDSHCWEPFVFHLEDDFTFNRPVRLDAMAQVLTTDRDLAQMALRRQPWNDEERAAGGIVEQHPEDFEEQFGPNSVNPMERPAYLVHRRFFTTNPSLYRRTLCQRTWPNGDHSEGMFSADLFTDPHARCAFWGARDSGEWVTHIGRERVGVGY